MPSDVLPESFQDAVLRAISQNGQVAASLTRALSETKAAKDWIDVTQVRHWLNPPHPAHLLGQVHLCFAMRNYWESTDQSCGHCISKL